MSGCDRYHVEIDGVTRELRPFEVAPGARITEGDRPGDDVVAPAQVSLFEN